MLVQLSFLMVDRARELGNPQELGLVCKWPQLIWKDTVELSQNLLGADPAW